MSFAEIPIITDRETALAAFVEKMQERFPGWEAADGDLLLWFAEWVADEYPDLANLTAEMSALAFATFGGTVLGVEAIPAAGATATTTWTMTDSAGHTIPEGTQVQIAEGDDLYAFATTQEVSVPNGSSATSAGGVTIRALVEGEIANGLTADPTLIDALPFVDSIDLVTTTSGGADAEDPDDYLDRLKDEFELLSKVLILPADVAIAARRVAGVARATVVDGYNPDDDTTGNEKMVTVFAIDEDGANVSAGVKTAIVAELEPRREVGFIFNVDDPTRTTVKVSTTVTSFDGVDATGLQTAIVSVLTDYLSASNWGLDPFDDDPGIWLNQTVVYRNELISLVDQVDGVDRVVSLTLAEQSGSLGTSDVTLAGVAALPAPGTLTVTVS